MNNEQREGATRYLGEGAKLREAAGMVGASWRDFARDWTLGRRDSEADKESDLAAWYRAATGARARIRAVKRREAAEVAGSRESSDLLAYVRALEEEEEPFAEEEHGVREERPILNLSDRIEVESDPAERERMRDVLQKGTEALHEMFSEMARQEMRATRPDHRRPIS